MLTGKDSKENLIFWICSSCVVYIKHWENGFSYRTCKNFITVTLNVKLNFIVVLCILCCHRTEETDPATSALG